VNPRPRLIGCTLGVALIAGVYTSVYRVWHWARNCLILRARGIRNPMRDGQVCSCRRLRPRLWPHAFVRDAQKLISWDQDTRPVASRPDEPAANIADQGVFAHPEESCALLDGILESQ
jgi:hypothetical protein